MTEEHREKMLLQLLIDHYEKNQWGLSETDPAQLIRIRMKQFGYSAADLARQYGDKGTISKVLHYKQPLSLNMIRIFSKMLQLPADLLTREYVLHPWVYTLSTAMRLSLK